MNTRLEKLDYLANWPSIWPVSPSTMLMWIGHSRGRRGKYCKKW